MTEEQITSRIRLLRQKIRQHETFLREMQKHRHIETARHAAANIVKARQDLADAEAKLAGMRRPAPTDMRLREGARISAE